MEKQAYSIAEFCFAHGFCRASFYNMLKRDEGPRVMKVGGRTLISHEAATEWRREREANSGPKAA
jgi:predicted DNA-binding transcriptional regulator AlpA